MSSNLEQGRGVQHHVIKVFSDLRQVSGFFWVLQFPNSKSRTVRVERVWVLYSYSKNDQSEHHMTIWLEWVDTHIYVIITSTTKLKLRDTKLALGYMHSYCSTLTVLLLLFYPYCSILTVLFLLFYSYCFTLTVLLLLLYSCFLLKETVDGSDVCGAEKKVLWKHMKLVGLPTTWKTKTSDSSATC
jgi:hypothetical protein